MEQTNNSIDIALYQAQFNQYPAESIRQIEQMQPGAIAELLLLQPVNQVLKIWERISPELGARVLNELPVEYSAELMELLNPNVGASLLRCLSDEKQDEILATTSTGTTNDLKRAIAYPIDTAGSLMDTHVMYFRSEMTVGEALTVLRNRPKHNYRKVYTVDEKNHLNGMLEIGELALASPDSLLTEHEQISPVFIEVTAGREEIVSLFEKFKVTDLPVVDFDNRLLGVVRYHALVDAAIEESSVDIQTMVGVSKDERALSPASLSVKKRLPWLEINLLTAFLAAAVVGIFEDTIAQYTALAILLPVVAGQSGNTGAQALAVTMRGLALKEIYPRMWPRILFKEFNAGMWNGIVIALTTAIGVYIWSDSTGLSLIILLSMTLSMIIASVSGAAIPILLTVTGQDPAQSSSIFLTTVTDIAGFFSFLGIATLLITLI